MTNPPANESPRPTTLAGKLLAIGGVLLSCAYLANLGAGIFPELPDNLPAIGNLDEVFFSGLLIVSLHKLGIQVIPGLTGSRPQPPAVPGR